MYYLFARTPDISIQAPFPRIPRSAETTAIGNNFKF
jgi:hypothetical protein